MLKLIEGQEGWEESALLCSAGGAQSPVLGAKEQAWQHGCEGQVQS